MTGVWPVSVGLPVAAGLDSDLVIYIVILLASIIGGILQKKKSGEKEAERRVGGRRRPIAGPPRIEPPPATTQPPIEGPAPTARPARVPPPPRPEPARVAVSPPGKPVEPPVFVRTEVPRLEPPDVRPLRRPAEERRRAAAGPRRPVPAEAQAAPEIEPEDLELHTMPLVATPGTVEPRPQPGGPAAVPAERLRAMLHDPGDLRAAVALSEILAPPLALRDEQ